MRASKLSRVPRAFIQLIAVGILLAAFYQRCYFRGRSDEVLNHSTDALKQSSIEPNGHGLRVQPASSWCAEQLSYFNERDPLGSSVPDLSFKSQYSQDWFLYSALFRNTTRGSFVDLAAAWPEKLSNTFFFESCLGFHGLLIDSDEAKAQTLRERRRNPVECTCIVDVPGIKRVSTGNSGKTGIVGYADSTESTREMSCVTLTELLLKHKMYQVDFMSLDVEGSEPLVMEGLDLQQIRIDVLVIETSHNLQADHFEGLRAKLADHDYIKVANLNPGAISGPELDSQSDEVFILKKSRFYHKYENWRREVCLPSSPTRRMPRLKRMCGGQHP